MTIPIWVRISGGVVLYLAVGMIQSIVRAFRSGQRGEYGMDAENGLLLIFLWPALNCGELFLWVMDKYDALLSSVRDRGKKSVMPPENADPGGTVVPSELPFSVREYLEQLEIIKRMWR